MVFSSCYNNHAEEELDSASIHTFQIAAGDEYGLTIGDTILILPGEYKFTCAENDEHWPVFDLLGDSIDYVLDYIEDEKTGLLNDITISKFNHHTPIVDRDCDEADDYLESILINHLKKMK